jgi:hypothetical protein
MKGAIYRENPHLLLELKEALENFTRNISLTELQTR